MNAGEVNVWEDGTNGLDGLVSKSCKAKLDANSGYNFSHLANTVPYHRDFVRICICAGSEEKSAREAMHSICNQSGGKSRVHSYPIWAEKPAARMYRYCDRLVHDLMGQRCDLAVCKMGVLRTNTLFCLGNDCDGASVLDHVDESIGRASSREVEDMSKGEYIPGVCNIGRSERRARLVAGWVGLVGTVALFWGCWYMKVVPIWRTIVFLPAMLAAIGFLQSYLGFCAGFGLKGAFNFGSNIGATDTVEQAEYRKKDQQKAISIIRFSAVIGLLVAIGAYFAPLP